MLLPVLVAITAHLPAGLPAPWLRLTSQVLSPPRPLAVAVKQVDRLEPVAPNRPALEKGEGAPEIWADLKLDLGTKAQSALMKDRFSGFEDNALPSVPAAAPVEAMLATPPLPLDYAAAPPVSARESDEETGFLPLESSLVPPLNSQQGPRGRAEAVDVTLLRVNDQVVRLSFLTAPAKERRCTLLSGAQENCRQAALDQLSLLLRYRTLSCDGPADQVRCRIGMSDVGEWIVRRGWATPGPGAPKAYASAQRFAQNFKLGIWRE